MRSCVSVVGFKVDEGAIEHFHRFVIGNFSCVRDDLEHWDDD